MAKSCNQKGKILYLERMLSETTGEKPVSMQEILTKLEERGIRAERKSIYDDLETLRDFGMEIHYRRGREGGYFTENTKKTEEGSSAITNEGEETKHQEAVSETGEITAKATAQKEQTLSGRVPAPVRHPCYRPGSHHGDEDSGGAGTRHRQGPSRSGGGGGLYHRPERGGHHQHRADRHFAAGVDVYHQQHHQADYL